MERSSSPTASETRRQRGHVVRHCACRLPKGRLLHEACCGIGRGGHRPRSSLDMEACTDGGEVLGVDALVEGEQRHHDLRDAACEPGHGRAEPAVADHRRAVPHHLRLRPPLLDPDVGGRCSEIVRVHGSASREQDPHRTLGEGGHHLRVDLRETRQPGGDRAEADVEEWVRRIAPGTGKLTRPTVQ